MSETSISNGIALTLSREFNGKVITWRNNVGVGIAISARGGKFTKILGAVIALVNKMGAKASPVKYGLCEGSSDRIGIRTVKVTPEMVGTEVGLFLALEVKTKTGQPSDEQINFIRAVRDAGGLAGVVRSPDEAIAVCCPLEGV